MQSSRTPHGVRGLKFLVAEKERKTNGSHPSRGAWIEIMYGLSEAPPTKSHPSRGAWIEIGAGYSEATETGCRTPHGVRGLKYRTRLRRTVNP